MSHLSIDQLKKNISFVKKYTNCPICIDTEGAQIRTKVKKRFFLKKNQKLIIKKNSNNDLFYYPDYVFDKIRNGDIFNIGFENLKIIIKKIYKKKNYIESKVISEGFLDTNKGVHLENRQIRLNPLTIKDFDAIKVCKKLNIQNFALSFANSAHDVIFFNNLIKFKSKNIFKIETKRAVDDFRNIIKIGDIFLIDRGDLSKEISIFRIPEIQRKIIKIKNSLANKNKKVYIATNLLESMISNNFPTRGEANDIYSSLEMGADGLVLAAETAIGKYPIDCVEFVKKMITQYNRY